MRQNIKEVVISGVFVFIIGFILWPPRGNYWMLLYDGFEGQKGPIMIVGILSLPIIFGISFGKITNIQLLNFIIGGIISYIVGMWMIKIGIDPISPVHLILYGILLVFLIGGMAVSDYTLSLT